jgi:metal-responsive CopG/Arc/MetJ family transcriptional regulator
MPTTQIAVRLNDAELETLDAEVTAHRATNRSTAIRQQIAKLSQQQAAEKDVEIILAATANGQPLYPDLEDMFDSFTYPPVD